MAARTRRPCGWLPSFLLLAFMVGAIMLACSKPCFAADIQPPTDEEVDEFARGSILYEEGWSIHEIIKMHKITKQGGELEVYYYLYVVYTATLPAKDDPETFYAHAAYETGDWKSSAGGPTVYQGGYYGAPHRAAESMGDALSALDGAMQELFDITGVEPGWPVVSPDGKIVSPGSAGTTRTGGGKKIPGPGNWWQWLTGTVAAGAIAAGIGLLSTLFGTAPAPAVGPTPSPQPPPAPTHDLPHPGRTRTLSPDRPPTDYEIYDDSYGVYIAKQTMKNIGNDIMSIPGALQDAFNNLMDKALWVREKVGDVESMRDSLKELQEMTLEKGRADRESLEKVVRDPGKAFHELGDKNVAWIRSASEELKKNPLGFVKGILGVDWWKNAMDHTKPVLERLGYATMATLNAIGLIEGASGLMNWLFGGGAKGAGKALIADKLDDAAKAVGLVEDKLDDAARGAQKLLTYNEPKLLTHTPAKPPRKLITLKGRLGEADLSKASTVWTTGQKPFFDNLGRAGKGRLNTTWKNGLRKAESKVKSFKRAMKSGDVQSRVKAILDIQRDPLAIQRLNAKDKGTIKTFNRQLRKMQNEAMNETKLRIAEESGVDPDQVEVFRATNPKALGSKVKAKMDQDLTVRVRGEDGIVRDLPAERVQQIYDESFFRAAGCPEGVTPEQLGRECRNVAVDRHSAEAFGMKPEDWEAMQLGKPTSHTDTISRTMQHKANESFARADQLARSGDVRGAMNERWLGQRETVKAFNNQVKGRVEQLSNSANPQKIAEINSKIADVEDTIKEMEKMIGEGVSPVKIDDFLRSRGTTAEDLARKVADIYKGLTP